MTVAIALPSLSLSSDEHQVLDELTVQLARFRPENLIKADYYDGKSRLEDLRIALPPTLAGLAVAVGWPAAAVDCVEERLDFEGWNTAATGVEGDDPFGLEELYLANDLDVESIKVHLDALIYGVGFAAVTTGFEGEPDPLVTVESPLNMTATIDARTRKVTAAYMQRLDVEDRIVNGALFLPNETIWLENKSPSAGSPSGWSVIQRDRHSLGEVAVAAFVNQSRSSGPRGHSEITETVRRLTQSGLRTLANAELAREFYAAPQRFVLGAKESFFLDGNGDPVPAWKSYMGRMLALERDEYGDLPDIKEFRGQGLETFFGMMKMYAQLLSGHIGIPQNYLGFATDNPPSAEAINAMEFRLVKRAERRQRQFGGGWTQLARLATMVREGSSDLPKEAMLVRPKWRPAHTPTLAATADATTKLIQAGVLPAESTVTWDRLDISRVEQKQLQADLRKQTVSQLVSSLGSAPPVSENASKLAARRGQGDANA